jgi:hypothetical protein
MRLPSAFVVKQPDGTVRRSAAWTGVQAPEFSGASFR